MTDQYSSLFEDGAYVVMQLIPNIWNVSFCCPKRQFAEDFENRMSEREAARINEFYIFY